MRAGSCGPPAPAVRTHLDRDLLLGLPRHARVHCRLRARSQHAVHLVPLGDVTHGSVREHVYSLLEAPAQGDRPGGAVGGAVGGAAAARLGAASTHSGKSAELPSMLLLFTSQR